MNTVTNPSFGLFVKKNFLGEDLCESIRAEMSSSGGNPASIVKTDERLLDEKVRRTVEKTVSDETRALLNSKLSGVRSELESFFAVTLSHHQKPAFLYYRPGDFFQVHVDRGTNPKNPETVKERKVSAVVFLNDETDEPGDDTYTGGSLIIYGILKDPRFESRGFKLPGAAGTLLAFRSDLFHEVTPVTRGSRFTVVSWFA